MRWWAPPLLLLGACDQVFGLDEREPTPTVDAPPGDQVPIDALISCPELGQTPVFAPVATQVIQNCFDFMVDSSRTRASVTCAGSPLEIAVGPADGPFDPPPGLMSSGTMRIDLPRVVPEGDQILVRHWDTSTVTARVRAFNWANDGTFTPAWEITAVPMFDTSVRFGTPTDGPMRRIMLRDRVGEVRELEISALGAAEAVGTYTATALGVGDILQVPNLTPDGLRMVFAAYATATATFTAGVYYADRATRGGTFGIARIVPGVPSNGVYDLFMTANCDRLYFSSNNSVFWIPRKR